MFELLEVNKGEDPIKAKVGGDHVPRLTPFREGRLVLHLREGEAGLISATSGEEVLIKDLIEAVTVVLKYTLCGDQLTTGGRREQGEVSALLSGLKLSPERVEIELSLYRPNGGER
jgi:hypothetical protein